MTSPHSQSQAFSWDPDRYLTFADERSRPFVDLVGRVGAEEPHVVVDLGCGAGNLTLLLARRWPAARVLGVDSSPQMLRVAARRVARNHWSNVATVRADATTLSVDDLAATVLATERDPMLVDAVFSVYALSVMSDPAAALSRAAALLTRGGRMGIVDMQRPTGAARAFTPLARVACALGGADIDAHPWEWLETRAHDVRRASRRGGHIQVVTGVLT